MKDALQQLIMIMNVRARWIMKKYIYDSVSIGENILRLRQQKLMTREELSFNVDRSVSHMAQIERGARKMSVDLLIELMNVLEVDANEILGIKSDNNKETIDKLLHEMDAPKQRYFTTIFSQMLAVPMN